MIHMLYNDTESALTENYVGFEITNNNLIFIFFSIPATCLTFSIFNVSCF